MTGRVLFLALVVVCLGLISTANAGTACEPSACAPACEPAATCDGDCQTCPLRRPFLAKVRDGERPVLRAVVAAPVRAVKVATAPVRWVANHRPVRKLLSPRRRCCR